MLEAWLEQLRDVVLADERLVARLAPLDREGLSLALVELAAEHRLAVERADVEEAILAASRSWRERWI